MDPDTSELWQVTRIACRSEKVETAASAIGGVLQELPPVTFDFHLADDLTISGEGDSVIRKQIAVWNKDLSFVPIFRQCADGRVTFLYALRTKPRT
jgi:hypothetical protein